MSGSLCQVGSSTGRRHRRGLLLLKHLAGKDPKVFLRVMGVRPGKYSASISQACASDPSGPIFCTICAGFRRQLVNLQKICCFHQDKPSGDRQRFQDLKWHCFPSMSWPYLMFVALCRCNLSAFARWGIEEKAAIISPVNSSYWTKGSWRADWESR